MSISFANGVDARSAARGLVPLCTGAGVYLFFLLAGDGLLGDSDSFWHIKIGQWIIDHRAVPYSDFYSLTKFGESWVSTSWLSQVLYAASYSSLGWAGPVIMASLAIAATASIFIHLLNVHFETAHSVPLAILALVLSMDHLLARPHILALPVMVAWVGALMAAADRRTYPSWLLLPVIALWSNLHGGFVLGLALIAPIALEALWSAQPERRVALAARWVVFAIGALAASCCTPYGWNTLLGAAKILNLGELLSLISEWAPANFSSFGFFEAALLGLIALALSSGLVVSLPRVLLVLGLTWMALTHVRNIETFAFLIPLVLAKPLAGRWKLTHATIGGEIRSAPYVTVFASLTIVAAGWTSTSVYMKHHHFAFTATQTPAAAVDVLEQRQVQRIFNSYQFGGYLIARDIKPFIDSRAELYGEKFVMKFVHAVEARKVDDLLHMLDDFRMEATLLTANSPAAQVLNHVHGWKQLYADEIAVVHVRTDQPLPNAARAPEASR